MATVEVTHSDGTTDTLTHISSERRQNFNQSDVMKVRVPRSEANSANLNPDHDEVLLKENGTVLYGGVLGDIDRRGKAITTLIVDSFERYARESKPSGADVGYTNVKDTTVVNDALLDVSKLTAGTIENVKSSLTFNFNHVSPARRIRIVRDASGGEVLYNGDKTVDYVARLGSDKSSTTTISPDKQHIEGFKVERDAGQKSANHLRMLGSGEGDAQVVIDVTASSFQTGDREIWDTYTFKDISAASTLRDIGEELLAELETEMIEVKATIKGLSVSLGDTYRVYYEEEELDHALRVVELTTILSERGTTYEATLSNRNLSRHTRSNKVVQDVERLNRGSAGANIGVYDDPNAAPQVEGKIIYITGANTSYEEGIWRHDGNAYTNVYRGDVVNKRVHASKSVVVPVGIDKFDLMVLPVGTDKYAT